MTRRLATLAGAAVAALAAATSAHACRYASLDDVLDAWIGHSLYQYERENNRRPFETLARPQNRTEYSYRAVDEWIGGVHYDCIERMIVDDATGEIVGWSYEGTDCRGPCY